MSFGTLGSSGGGVRLPTPLSVYDDERAGALFDPRSMWTLKQLSTGKTAAAVDGPVGAFTGLSRSAAAGSNLLNNGGFSTDTAWTKQAGWSISGGQAIAATSSSTGILQNASLTALALYQYEIDIDSLSSGGLSVQPGFDSYKVDISASGVHTGKALRGTNGFFYINSASGTTAAAINSVECRLWPSVTAIQATAGNRPTLKSSGNQCWLEHDGSDALVATMPDLGTNVQIITASEDGVEVSIGQTVGAGAYTLPQKAKLYGHMLVAGDMTPAQWSGVLSTMCARAGADCGDVTFL